MLIGNSKAALGKGAADSKEVMKRYAESTGVDVGRSKIELEKIAAKYGATQFGALSDWENNQGTIQFKMNNINVQIAIPMPCPGDFIMTAAGRRRKQSQIDQEIKKEHRRRWRSAVLIVKAKLEGVACGITTMQKEFMPDVLLPNGHKVIDYVLPVLDKIASGEQIIAMLPPPEGNDAH